MAKDIVCAEAELSIAANNLVEYADFLSKSISNRRVKVQFTNAKGAVADNLTTAANQLNEIGVALASLIQKTETAITNTRVSFTNTDNALAQWLSSSEE